ncbi:RNA-directed DNA polymerase from mobile element jockey [Trichonephila clavipes]|nr:RNA-directed DNA polymerase from mobile element jockey [Trichonephila clavipes]
MYTSSITSSTTCQQLWRKVEVANGLYGDFTFPILETSTAVYSSPTDVANLIGETFASVSSPDSYSATFLATKNRSERTPINFRGRQFPYNCDLIIMTTKSSFPIQSSSSLFNRIWMEQVYPSIWEGAIVIHYPKTWKRSKTPSQLPTNITHELPL